MTVPWGLLLSTAAAGWMAREAVNDAIRGKAGLVLFDVVVVILNLIAVVIDLS